MPQPGWFFDAEADPLHAHFKNRLNEALANGKAPPTIVQAAGADLNWAVSPRVEVGYRLASGFGEFALSYRSLATSGAQAVTNLDGAAAASSRLDFHVLDVDYASREFSLWPNWEMQWTIGGRTAWIYYDARDVESFVTAAAGSGLVSQRVTNYFNGFGPHAGFEIARRFNDSGWSLLMKADGAGMIGWLRQGFFAQDTTGAVADTHDDRVTDIPMLHGEIGLSWQSCGPLHAQVFVGYEYEYWWNVGREAVTNSRADMSDQGLVLRAGINY
jgi:hypothetical protein